MSILLIDAKYYHMLAYPLYWIAVLVLVGVLFLGKEVNGARSWIVMGPVAIQPTEFVKFTTALALARYMSSYTFDIRKMHDLLRIGLLLGIPVLIVMLQNDTGSALVYGSFLFMLYREGFNGWVYIALLMTVSLFVFSFLLDPVMLLIVLIVVCVAGEGIINGDWRSKIDLSRRPGTGFDLCSTPHSTCRASIWAGTRPFSSPSSCRWAPSSCTPTAASSAT